MKSVRSGKGRKLKSFVKPMLASIGDEAFDDKEWLFEIKWDGYRAVAETGKSSIKLYSRNGLSFVELYKPVVAALSKIKKELVLDGEIVVIDKKGKSNFQNLQHYGENPGYQIIYYVFDCIKLDGKNIAKLPLLERKKLLKKNLPKNNKFIKYSEHTLEKGKAFFKQMVKKNLEGMMAKKADSDYLTGIRTRNWLKIKNQQTQEAVIAGYTEPRGERKYFGSLVLGIFDKGKFRYIGHTGTGFNEKTLKELHSSFKKIERKTSPFEEKIHQNAPITWVNPTMVCNIKFTEVTKDGQLRHPVYQGLRVDKKAKEAKLDKPLKKIKT